MKHDAYLIYECPDDRVWVAHNLYADQIGTGDNIVEALADCMKAVEQVIALAAHDPSVVAWREAPEDVQRQARNARQLPQKMYEVAYKKARGTWPDYLSVDLTPAGDVSVLRASNERPEMAST
jgi:hypothetical protein